MADPAPAQQQEEPQGYSSLWESVGNKALLVREAGVNVVAGIPAIPGYLLDLANMADRAMGFNHYEGSAGDWIQTKAKAGLDAADPLKWMGVRPEVKTTADAVILEGGELIGDIAVTVYSGGAAAPKLAGTAGKFTSMFGAAAVEGGSSMSLWSRLAKTFAKHADEGAEAAAKPGILSRNPTIGGMIATHATIAAVPLGVAAAEVTTHGAVSQATIDTMVAGTKAAINSGLLGKDDLEPAIDNIGFALEVLNPLDISAHNAAVEAVINFSGEPDSPETIARAKGAAVGYLLMPTQAAAIFAKYGIRSQLVDDTIPDRNEADKFLAEGLIDDIVEKSHTNALGDNQVTRDDVKHRIQQELVKPDSTFASMIKGGRLENGLRQMWPDMQFAPAPATESNLTNAFHNARDDAANALNAAQDAAADQSQDWLMNRIMGIPVVGSIISFFMKCFEGLMEMFSPQGNVTAQTDNPQRLQALQGQTGGTMPEVLTHDGASQEAPAVRRAPGLSPLPAM